MDLINKDSHEALTRYLTVVYTSQYSAMLAQWDAIKNGRQWRHVKVQVEVVDELRGYSGRWPATYDVMNFLERRHKKTREAVYRCLDDKSVNMSFFIDIVQFVNDHPTIRETRIRYALDLAKVLMQRWDAKRSGTVNRILENILLEFLWLADNSPAGAANSLKLMLKMALHRDLGNQGTLDLFKLCSSAPKLDCERVRLEARLKGMSREAAQKPWLPVI